MESKAEANKSQRSRKQDRIFRYRDESRKIQIIGRIYLVGRGRGIWGSDLGINKFGLRPAAGTILILTKQLVPWGLSCECEWMGDFDQMAIMPRFSQSVQTTDTRRSLLSKHRRMAIISCFSGICFSCPCFHRRRIENRRKELWDNEDMETWGPFTPTANSLTGQENLVSKFKLHSGGCNCKL